MITRADIIERVREWGLREDVVEKDYVLGWLLWGIGSHESLSRTWVFKGGTCLKKCYIETYRFSEDLDFTILPGGPIRADELEPVLRDVLQRVADESGLDFSGRPPLLKMHSSGQYTEGRIYYRGPRNAPVVGSVKLDLMMSEKVVRPTVRRRVRHAYPDELPLPATIRCYALEELFAEKVRAMGERGRPRDLYDIVNLFRREDLRAHPDLIRTVLTEKCAHKGVPVPTFASIRSASTGADLLSEWENMLGHQLPALPPLEAFWDELERLFAWLEGRLAEEIPQAIPRTAAEETPERWTPPSTAWTWGVGVPLETVRFAAANHLCIRLGYRGDTRIIEPYSLRRTRDGNLILHGVRIDSREPRSYRVDRIESVEVTKQPFKPVYLVEFTTSGPIEAPPMTTAKPRTDSRSRQRHTRSGWIYILECTYCRKRFRRRTRDTTLRRHKDRQGYGCAGRHGYVVDTRYV